MESEKDTETYLTKQVEAFGGLCRKYVSPGVRGVPDRLCFMPNGKLLIVEVKSEGLLPDLHQMREHLRLSRRGFIVRVIDTKQAVDNLLKEIKDEILRAVPNS